MKFRLLFVLLELVVGGKDALFPEKYRWASQHFDLSSQRQSKARNLPIVPQEPVNKENQLMSKYLVKSKDFDTHEHLEFMLRNVFSYPRNHMTNETAKALVKNFIIGHMENVSRLETSVQTFSPLQFFNLYDDSGPVPVGSNIIGILKGKNWGLPSDHPVLVGAHWDTVKFSPGTNDNGSGVAALLEMARIISKSECRNNDTLIFVAFDLEEFGSQGSLLFIKEYLVKNLFPVKSEIDLKSNFQGAIILDTILNFDNSEFSQEFPNDWRTAVPKVAYDLKEENYKGDFISGIYREQADFSLFKAISDSWNGKFKNVEEKFRMKGIPLSLSSELPDRQTLIGHFNFLRSDHSRFWYMNDTDVPFTMKSVLITDTGPYRGSMKQCYHNLCDDPQISLPQSTQNIQFLKKITTVISETVERLAGCLREP